MKNLLTIAGSDCSGGAGIQADLKTFSAHGAFGMSVVVSVVAENTSRVISIQDITPEVIKDQIDAVFEDIPVHGVKTGMLSGIETMNAVAEKLREYRPANLVVDPVMIAKGGCALMHPDALNTLISEIIPLSFILTPNIPEAETITGKKISSVGEMKKAAAVIYKMGAKNVLIKGGHSAGDAEDILFDGVNYFSFITKRIDTKNTHGTGCTFSSAITANLANGMDIQSSVKASKDYVTTAIKHALPIGKGHGPTNHFYKLYKESGIL
ncbi:MAG TPA: bifunctional hydroxymethylpyrimidine kinase/phosphomethylpyrimidine kinase [Spirochaetota bacterium]|nr:bifunctional hydroxymethylpyrimidine kinase/phosphomethylpyrimidine kinase [Spirochaetota bacterium]HPJ36649.1 bifunctional hydroxymethylpyrimidine kinase/phosphomethylpyrimidine kinase [Spirochaetota bacterium]HRX48260.1 bifunctional hydroxymethylpyrimidine kinase/phosphomethylpyrimidine kinase [Spirochaetota bacterium]